MHLISRNIKSNTICSDGQKKHENLTEIFLVITQQKKKTIIKQSNNFFQKESEMN